MSVVDFVSLIENNFATALLGKWRVIITNNYNGKFIELIRAIQKKASDTIIK